MDQNEVLKILTALADGVNPITGEVFPKESPYQHPQIVRALCNAVGLLQPKIRRIQKKLPERSGKPWDKNEDASLIAAFDSGTSIKDLSLKHQRTIGAVQARLARLGKIAPLPIILKAKSL